MRPAGPPPITAACKGWDVTGKLSPAQQGRPRSREFVRKAVGHDPSIGSEAGETPSPARLFAARIHFPQPSIVWAALLRLAARASSATGAPAGTQLQRVFQRLRDEIVACQLAPGAKLNIVVLAQDHGVSPGAVREALAMLQKEGFVDVQPQKGYSVQRVSPEDLLDLTLARVDIERACVASSLAHGDIEWESLLVSAFHRTCRTAAEADFSHGDPAWIAAHDSFHSALVAACRSRRLLATRSLLYDQSERYRRLSLSFSVERDVESEHRMLFEAALARDIPRTQDLLEAHIRGTAEALIDATF